MSGDTQVPLSALTGVFWKAHVAAFPGDEREFFAVSVDELGAGFRNATEAGVQAVVDAVRAEFAQHVEALLDGWRERVRELEGAEFPGDIIGQDMATVQLDTLRAVVRKTEAAVNAALKGGATS